MVSEIWLVTGGC